jgi:DNA-binding response OmpR family regulator
MRILLVEDDAVVRRLLARSLRLRGTVDEAPDVAHAIARLHATRYDLVVTDHSLPDGTGMTVLSHAKEVHEGAIRVLISGGEVEVRPELAQRVFLKPAELPNFIEWLDRLRQGRGSDDAAAS